MIAGRFFWISPPVEGLKLIHQTSPRFIADVPHRSFRPFQSLRLALLVSSHSPVGIFQLLREHMGANRVFDEATDATPTHDGVQTVGDLLVDRDCQLLLHGFYV